MTDLHKPIRNNYPTVNAYKNAYLQWKRRTDPKYLQLTNTYSTTGALLRGNRMKSPLIGCTHIELREHIEKQFQPGMTWANYGEAWELDHIEPLLDAWARAGAKGMQEAAHYSNLRPEWKAVNRAGKKGKKHSTNDRFITSTLNSVLNRFDDYLELSIAGIKEIPYNTILVDLEWESRLDTHRICMQYDSSVPIVYKNGVKSPQSFFHFFPGKFKAKRWVRISGEPNDWRRKSFRFRSDKEIKQARLDRFKKNAKMQKERMQNEKAKNKENDQGNSMGNGTEEGQGGSK